jgi:hypothetical protein
MLGIGLVVSKADDALIGEGIQTSFEIYEASYGICLSDYGSWDC